MIAQLTSFTKIRGQRRWLTLAFVFLLYTLIAVIALRTLVAQFSTAVPSGKESDFYQFLWNYWWIGYAFEHGQSPLWSDYVLYPHVNNLSIHTLAAVWYPLYAAAKPIIGHVAAGNLIVLSGFPLAGTLMFAWLRRQLDLATIPGLIMAFLGGLAFAFSPNLHTHSAWMQLNLTALFWFPLILLLWNEIAFPRRLPRLVTGVILGLALWGLWLTDLQYLVWIPSAVGLYALWTLWVHRRVRHQFAAVMGSAVLALAIMSVLIQIYPLSALREISLNPNEFPPAGLNTLQANSVSLPALFGLAPPDFIRTMGHLLMWLGWLAVGAAVLRRTKPEAHSKFPKPPIWFWFIALLIPLIFMLGPGIEIPLPYRLLHELLKGQLRIPARFTAPTAVLLITFIAVVLTPYFIRLAQHSCVAASLLAVGVGIGLFIDSGNLEPFPTRIMPDYAIHHEIAQDERDFVILEVPEGTQYGWTGIGDGYYSMYYVPFHQHKIVNGWLARIPYSTLDYYIQSPLFSWLADTRDLDTGAREQVDAEFAQYLQEWPVGYVIAYRDWIERPERQLEWIGWLNTQPGLCPAEATDDASLIWWRAQHLTCSPESLISIEHIEMGTPASWRFIGSGWYLPESISGADGRWSGQNANLRVTLDPNTDYEIIFSALPFGEGRSVSINGSEPIPLQSGGWHEYQVIIPANGLESGHLTLEANGAESPSALGISGDTRSLSAAYGSFQFRVMSP